MFWFFGAELFAIAEEGLAVYAVETMESEMIFGESLAAFEGGGLGKAEAIGLEEEFAGEESFGSRVSRAFGGRGRLSGQDARERMLRTHGGFQGEDLSRRGGFLGMRGVGVDLGAWGEMASVEVDAMPVIDSLHLETMKVITRESMQVAEAAADVADLQDAVATLTTNLDLRGLSNIYDLLNNVLAVIKRLDNGFNTNHAGNNASDLIDNVLGAILEIE
jgi:hypothetical protein